MEERYLRNLPAISAQEQRLLRDRRVLVVGCGGLGGYLIEYLARLGVGRLTTVDGDCFQPSNLNRQLLCTWDTLGRSKVRTAAERVRAVNPDVEFQAVEESFSAENGDGLVRDQDLVLDALDDVPARLLLEEVCARQGVPLVHGAVCGWTAQVAVVPPGSGLLRRLYAAPAGGEKSVLPFTPAFCAAIQAAEAVKLLCGWAPSLEEKVLAADLSDLDWTLLSSL